ncbi:MAG: hypothetical protein KC501_10445 [Myxococcales bacterium]|nr:hypothetical protein [Myxococcales bacterium]
MKRLGPLLVTLLAASSIACTGDDDEGGPAPTLMMTADRSEIATGETITLTIEVENFELSGEEHQHLERGFDPPLAAEPGDPLAAEAEYTGPRVGHVHVYLDDLMVNPLAMITTSPGQVVVDAEPGAHTLIGRLHGTDHKIIEPQIIDEVEITVLAP